MREEARQASNYTNYGMKAAGREGEAACVRFGVCDLESCWHAYSRICWHSTLGARSGERVCALRMQTAERVRVREG